MKSLLSLSLLLTAAPLAAQDLPVPDRSGRILRLFDLTEVGPEREALPAGFGVDRRPADIAAEAETGARIAAFLRRYVEPPLGPRDDLTVLGGRWLALLGSPAQIASLDRLLARARAEREALVTTTVRLVQMPRAAFEQQVRPELVEREGDGVQFEAVLAPTAAAALLRAIQQTEGAEIVSAPRLTFAPLQRASVSIQEEIAYVQDFTLTRSGDQLVADPVVGVVQDGVHADLFAVLLGDGLLGVQCDVVTQEVQKPIQQFEADLGVGAPVTIQLPRTTGVRFRQTAQVAAGDVVVLAAQKVDGDYLLALVEARLEAPTEAR